MGMSVILEHTNDVSGTWSNTIEVCDDAEEVNVPAVSVTAKGGVIVVSMLDGSNERKG